MIDILTNALNNFLIYLQNERIAKDKNYDEALLAILEALTETQTYLEDDSNTERNRVKELELSKLWDTAAIKIRKFDAELADEMKYKGLYWLERLDLSRRELYKKGIALRQIRQKYERLYSSK
jgi:BMFP domain-containing protein YqiC